MLASGLTDHTGRTAYLAGFHAAQALIFEHLGKVLKTHKGVQAEFLRLTKNDPRIESRLSDSCRAHTISKQSPIMKPARVPMSRETKRRTLLRPEGNF